MIFIFILEIVIEFVCFLILIWVCVVYFWIFFGKNYSNWFVKFFIIERNELNYVNKMWVFYVDDDL